MKNTNEKICNLVNQMYKIESNAKESWDFLGQCEEMKTATEGMETYPMSMQVLYPNNKDAKMKANSDVINALVEGYLVTEPEEADSEDCLAFWAIYSEGFVYSMNVDTWKVEQTTLFNFVSWFDED